VRVRFINSAAWSPWNVSVDGLPLTIIELDGQSVEPLAAPWIIVNVAQRVSFVIDFSKISGAALRASQQLYFRVEAMADTYPLGLEGMYANQGYKKLDPLFLGVIDFSTEAALGSAPRSAGGAAAATRPTYRLEDVPVQPFDALPPDQMAAQNTPAAEIDKATHRLWAPLPPQPA
jgi:FtsP/CotA-like multicopper oxidase with cupredoxin domain